MIPQYSLWLHYLAIASLAGGAVMAHFITRHRALWSSAPLAVGAGLLVAETAVRVSVTGRPPVVGTYENTIVVAFMIAVACIITLLKSPPAVSLRLVGWTAPWAAVALLYGLAFSSQPLPIGVEGRGLLAYGHALVGWTTFTFMLLATVAAGQLLAHPDDRISWRPVLERMLACGFAGLTVTMATGSLLSFAAFGSWYQWQLVEGLAALLWLGYGVAIHAFLIFGWRDRRLAIVTAALVPVFILAFWSWSVYSGTYHHFDRDRTTLTSASTPN